MQTAPQTHNLTREQLFNLVWDRPLRAVAEEFSMSANGLAKICDRLLVPYPPRGYWRRAAADQLAARPALPASPEGDETVVVAAGRAASRRTRTRRGVDERRDQMLDAAEDIADEALASITVRNVARAIGISETQGHNYFPTRLDLLVALARREIDAIEAERRQEIARGKDYVTLVMLSTLSYFRQAEKRGALLQSLVSLPDVRERLRSERRSIRASTSTPTVETMMNQSGMSRPVATAANRVMTAVCLRTGRLLAEKRIGRATAERLCLPIVIAAVNSNRSLAQGR